MFLALAENEAWYLKRVNLFIALAPIVFMEHAHGSIYGPFSKYESLILTAAKTVGVNEILSKDWDKKLGVLAVCDNFPLVCSSARYISANSLSSYNDKHRIAV